MSAKPILLRNLKSAPPPKIRKVKFNRPNHIELTPEEFEEWQAKLLPCPFCGEPGILEKGAIQYFARCNTDGCQAEVINAVSDASITLDMTVAGWNTRAHSVEFQEYDKYNVDPIGTVTIAELDILVNHWYDFIDEYKLQASWGIYTIDNIADPVYVKHITKLWRLLGNFERKKIEENKDDRKN